MKYDNIGFDPVFAEEHQRFEYQMSLYAERVNDTKIDNCLICPSFFDGKPRTRDNVVFANGVFLDMDGMKPKIDKTTGEVIQAGKPPIHPDEFAKLFPHLRMTIFNSYSSTTDWIRYRIYIPTDRVMTAKEYMSVTSSMVDLLPKDAGIDKTKIYPESIFYLPCQAGNPFGNFFQIFGNDERKVLFVDDWVLADYAVDEGEAQGGLARRSAEPIVRDDEKVRKAIDNWSPATAPKGCGNDHTFILACQLKKAGVEQHEAKAIMLQEAGKCHSRQSQSDRRKQVEYLMTNQWHKLR